jgi:hypothetical protein
MVKTSRIKTKYTDLPKSVKSVGVGIKSETLRKYSSGWQLYAVILEEAKQPENILLWWYF